MSKPKDPAVPPPSEETEVVGEGAESPAGVHTHQGPTAMPSSRKERRPSKTQLADQVLRLQQQMQAVIKHTSQAHAVAAKASQDAREAYSFGGLLMRTLTRKGLLAEKDVEETAKEVAAQIEAEKQKAAVEVRKEGKTLIFPPRVPPEEPKVEPPK